MKSLVRVLWIGFCLLLITATANAQMGMRSGPPSFSGVWNPVVGAGAAYEIQNASGEKHRMEIAIVGKETIEGKVGYWFEITTVSPHSGGEMVMKSLIVADGSDTTVMKMMMQMAGRPPMDMTAQMAHNPHSRQPVDIRDKADDVGSETITVPAGTFVCEHYRMKDGSGDTWVSPKVGVYGMVKHQGKESTMVLTKVITDARDKITGTPVPFDPSQMMRQPPQQ